MRTVQDGDNAWAAEWMAVAQRYMQHDHVIDGCAPTIAGGNMDVDVAAGNIYVGGVVVAFAGDTATHDVEGVLTVRYDLLTIDALGALNIAKGVAEKVAPDIPADEVLIAVVRVRNGETEVIGADLADARIIRDPRILAEGSAILAPGGISDVPFVTTLPYVVAAINDSATIGHEFEWRYMKVLATATDQTIRFYRTDGLGGNLAFSYRIMTAM